MLNGLVLEMPSKFKLALSVYAKISLILKSFKLVEHSLIYNCMSKTSHAKKKKNKEKKKERRQHINNNIVRVCACMCMCVCVREREKEKE
jgi:hypothetical protein